MCGGKRLDNRDQIKDPLFDLSHCMLCPRNCGVDRTAGRSGFCGEDATIHAARAALLYYEEPVSSGPCGSGAVFFTGCNMACIFCQNRVISEGERGAENGLPVQASDLSDIFFSLQDQGAANINLVTGSHFVPQIADALMLAKNRGLSIPVVWNSSAYEKVETLRLLDGLVDIYLPDFKFWGRDLAMRYAKAPDYREVAQKAITEMVRQCPEPLFSDGSHALDEDDDKDDPLMVRGVIVRHLCMPGQAEDSKRCIRWLYETFGDQIFLSIMNQYTPMPDVMDGPYEELKRTLTDQEYEDILDYAIGLGLSNGFLQEGGTVSKSFIPAFDGTGIRKEKKS